MLRRFYIQENAKGMALIFAMKFVLICMDLAPEPKTKKDRQLNTEILPMEKTTETMPSDTRRALQK